MTFYNMTGETRCLVEEYDRNRLYFPRCAFSPEELAELGPVKDTRPPPGPPTRLALKQGVTFRDDAQRRAWAELKNATCGVLALACGKGKTFLALAYAARRGVPTLIVSTQRAHLNNWEDELRGRFTWEGTVGFVGDKKDPWPLHSVAFATVQSLAKACVAGTIPKAFHDHYGLVIYDECHHMAASHFIKAVDAVAGDRLGLSATTYRVDMLQGVFFAHIGPIIHEDLEQNLIPTVYIEDLGTTWTAEQFDACKDKQGQLSFGKFCIALGQDAGRNEAILDCLLQDRAEGRIVYVLSQSPDHVTYLRQRYRERTGQEAGLIIGGTPSEDRLPQLNQYPVVFASLAVATEAYNRTDLDTVYFVTPFTSHEQAGSVVCTPLIQGGGRALRPLPGKRAIIRIFRDSKLGPARAKVATLIDACKQLGWSVVCPGQQIPLL